MPERSRPHVCLCADARREESYRALLGEACADVLITDPPYCLLTRRRARGDERDPKGRKNEGAAVIRFETVRAYAEFTAAWLPLAASRLTGESPLVVWTNWLGRAPNIAVARDCGYAHVWGEFVWAKRAARRAGPEELLRVYETALVLGRSERAPRAAGDAPEAWAVVCGYDDDGEAARWGLHPNHKPFSTLEPLVRAYARSGALVLDPFAGSGSIAAAAIRLGRRAACLEVVPSWAGIAERRARLAEKATGPPIDCGEASDRR